jgi:uncharacterized protein YdbL (DUF1318 family)
MHPKLLRRCGRLGLLAILATSTLACVTINVYFPEAAVKDLSEKIEDAVAREGAAAGGGAAPERQPSSLPSRLAEWASVLAGQILRLSAAPAVFAQEVAAPEITNPAIRQIIESRGARVADVNRFKASGAVGENNRALLEARDLQALPLADRAAVQRLIGAENADREQMFKEIAVATGADPATVPQIRETYAETLRQKAKAGEWIQLADGKWQQKG